jgi:1-phosphofructokinase family hexose kinase
MIAVAAVNSAVDKLLEIEALAPGRVLRTRGVTAWPGGKGVHVAACAATFGQTVRLTGLVDDVHREWFASWLRARGVDFHAIDTPTPIRTCLAIRESDGRITEILEPGPAVDVEIAESAFHIVVNVCRKAGVAVLSGSLPPGMSSDTYGRVVTALRDTRVLVDASGDLLEHAIAARPFAIKPNRPEAEVLAGMRIESAAAAAEAARAIARRGVPLVLISLGQDGAVACWDGRTCHCTAPRVTPLNDVGAGDCLLGALAAALVRGDNIADAIRLGVAAGTAKVLSPDTGDVRRSDIDALLPSVRLAWLPPDPGSHHLDPGSHHLDPGS